jgi:hypothetical protein
VRQLPRPAVGLDGGREEVRLAGREALEWQDPPGGSELGGPYDVELKDVGLADARVEPLHVELVALGGVVRRALHVDEDVRVERHEARDLPAQELTLGAKRAAREGDDRATVGACPAARAECHEVARQQK